MWIGHLAPAFFLKTFVPQASLGLLMFGSWLPDFLYFCNVFLGQPFESIQIAPWMPGTFTYICDMPYTHSLVGSVLLALLGGLILRYLFGKSDIVSVAFALSILMHFPLELPGHRQDLRIFISEPAKYGWGTFDSSFFTFLLEGSLIVWSYSYYINNTVPVRHKFGDFVLYFGIVLAIEHTLFAFNLVPTQSVRWIHTPLFLTQILATCWFAQIVGASRNQRLNVWNKIDAAQNAKNIDTYTGLASTGVSSH